MSKKKGKATGLSKYIASIEKEVERSFFPAAEKLDFDAIHDLRVALKKLRSSALFIASISKKFSYEDATKSSDKFFKRLGKVRDLQVSISLIQLHKVNTSKAGLAFYLFLNEKLIEKTVLLKNWRLKADFENLLKGPEYAREFSLEVKKEKLLKHGETVVQELASSIVSYSRTELHRARISLKQLHHVIDICRLYSPNFMIKEIDTMQLKTTEGILGQWHDLIILRSQLSQYFEGEDPRGLKRYDAKINREIKQLEEAANKQLALFDVLQKPV